MTGGPAGGLPDDEQDLAEAVLRIVAELEDRLPPSAVRVERDQDLAARLAGRPGAVAGITVDTGGGRLLLLDVAGGGFAASAATLVGGVVVARRRLRLTEWLSRLDVFLAARDEETAVAEAAAQRVLVTLGSADPADALTVRSATLEDDLRDLPARLEGRLPDDVVDSVRRTCAELSEAHARLPVNGREAHLVHRVATDYLPTTLRIFLELPPAWARRHTGFHGRTALDLLREQLDVLEVGARELHEALLAGDGERLVANGAFLAERFGDDSDLDLPEHTD